MSELSGYLLFIPIIFIIVVFHEFGHFIIAKIFKIEVEEFAIGFPPRLFAKKISSTIISLNAIPLGGYVKLPSIETPDKKERFSKTLSIKKIIIFSMGSFFNFLMTFLILVFIFLTPHKIWGGEIYIEKVAPNSPAEISGLIQGDIIRKINNNSIDTIDKLVSNISKNKNSPTKIIIERNKNLSVFGSIAQTERKELKITPRESSIKRKVVQNVQNVNEEVSLELAQKYNSKLKIGDEMTEGKMGVLINIKNPKQIDAQLSFNESIKKSYITMGLLFSGIKYIFIENNELSGESKFTGPVGIAQLTNQSSKQGLQSIAELVALISFSLGIFNLIPFPPLDGGKLFLELITISRNGNPLPSTFTYRLQLIGVSILFGLIIFVTLSDIINIFNG